MGFLDFWLIKIDHLSSKRLISRELFLKMTSFQVVSSLEYIQVRVLTKYYWIVQFIRHEQSLSFKASFEIELGSLDFNIVSEPPLRCWANLPPIMVHMFGG